MIAQGLGAARMNALVALEQLIGIAAAAVCNQRLLLPDSCQSVKVPALKAIISYWSVAKRLVPSALAAIRRISRSYF